MDVGEALASNPLYASLWRVKNPSRHGTFAKMERKDYTEWLNGHLSRHYLPKITNLEEDFADGTTLLKLTEILTSEKPSWPHLKPTLLPHRLNNIRMCLLHLSRIGVDITGILPEDIIHRDLKAALALSRAIYSRFQGPLQCATPTRLQSPSSIHSSTHLQTSQRIPPFVSASMTESQWSMSSYGSSSSSSSSPPSQPVWTKDDMAVFGWVERVLGVHITDYTQFHDGIVMCALVNHICPGTITQQQVLFSTHEQRLSLAIAVAHRCLGAPADVDIRQLASGVGQGEFRHYMTSLQAAHKHTFKDQLHVQFGCHEQHTSPLQTGHQTSAMNGQDPVTR